MATTAGSRILLLRLTCVAVESQWRSDEQLQPKCCARPTVAAKMLCLFLVAVEMQLLAQATKQLFADSLQLLFEGTIYLIKPCYRFVSVVVVVGASGPLDAFHQDPR